MPEVVLNVVYLCIFSGLAAMTSVDIALWLCISPVFVITKWATLLVDIHCPRGGS